MVHRSNTRQRVGDDRGRFPYRPQVEVLEDRLARGGILGPGLSDPFSLSGDGNHLAPAAAGRADPTVCPPEQTRVFGNFPGVIPILNHPLLQATVAGTAGAFQAHLVFQPIPVAPPAISDGCQENSRFTVEDFVGSLPLTGDAVRAITQAAFG